jgi:hypothetical protein
MYARAINIARIVTKGWAAAAAAIVVVRFKVGAHAVA